jgi:hypothetical protein
MAERKHVSQEIHDYLSKQGKKGGRVGGQKVKELIEAGKKADEEMESERGYKGKDDQEDETIQ